MRLLLISILISAFAFSAIGASIPSEGDSRKILGLPLANSSIDFAELSLFERRNVEIGKEELKTGACSTRDASPLASSVQELLSAFQKVSAGKICVQASNTLVSVFGIYRGASIYYSAHKGREVECDQFYKALTSIFTTCIVDDKVEGWLNIQAPKGTSVVGIQLYDVRRRG